MRAPEMNSDPQLDSTLTRDIVIAFCECPLHLDCILYCFECAAELEQESVADRFNLGAMEARKNLADYATMFLQQLEREGFVPLRDRGVTDHVGENDRCESALLGRHDGSLLSDFRGERQYWPFIRVGISCSTANRSTGWKTSMTKSTAENAERSTSKSEVRNQTSFTSLSSVCGN
jgi:hypothetical protein